MNVFIACASSEKIDKKYLELTKNVSDYLIEKDYNLVFGASNKSMMGVTYQEFSKNNKEVFAITPEVYNDELAQLTKSKHIITEDTIMRFKEIYQISDLIIILPGGIGTMAELTSTIEEARTIKNNKKIILYNYEGFYDELLEWFTKSKNLGFISNNIESIISIVKTDEEFKEKVGI